MRIADRFPVYVEPMIHLMLEKLEDCGTQGLVATLAVFRVAHVAPASGAGFFDVWDAAMDGDQAAVIAEPKVQQSYDPTTLDLGEVVSLLFGRDTFKREFRIAVFDQRLEPKTCHHVIGGLPYPFWDQSFLEQVL